MQELLKKLLPQPLLNYAYHLPKAFFASKMYGNPGKELKIIAVTGTDGKTTTTTLIYHILKTAKKKVGLISTVEAKIGRKSIETGLHVTSPDPFKLQALLRKMKSNKIKYVCLEVTSHGIDQFRTFPLRPEIAVLTNITHEHLDYHQEFDRYVKTKLKLLVRARHAIVNKDSSVFPVVASALKKTPFSTYSIENDSQLQATSVRLLKTKSEFSVGNVHYELPMTGKYNVYNALASVASCLMLGISPADIKKALLTFPGIIGRLDKRVVAERTIVIDFAHTPNALQESLINLRNMMGDRGDLIAVFGSAGLRDRTKRPLMGKAASEHATRVVLTAEDPRTEKIEDITLDIMSGVPEDKKKKFISIPDRQEAIKTAILTSGPGDWIGIFGKGHEKSMCYGVEETPWSDHEAVDQVVKELK